MKYKVLFADDEYWTREKMKTIIPWEKYHLEFMKPAENGEEVLEKILEEKPDILITDINMPYINGVELLKRINEKYSDIVTFIISGYDDFAYVKESFLQGSINYLLKPIGKIELVNALSKALEIISQRRQDEKQAKDEEMEILKSASLIQDREFSQLLEKEELPFTPNITMNNSVDFTGVTLILIKIHDMSELSAKYHYDMNLLSYSIKYEIKRRIDNEKVFIFNHIYRANEFIAVIDKEVEEIVSISRRLLLDFSKITTSPITIVISDNAYTLESIREAYIQTVTVLMTRPFQKNSIVLRADKGKNRTIKNRLTEADKNELVNLLQFGRKEEIIKLIFEKTGLLYCEQQGWDYLETRQTVKRILNLIQEFLMKRKNDPKEALLVDNSMEVIDKSLELLDVQYIKELLDDTLESVLTVGKEQASGDSMKEIVWQAMAYIEENYFEPLTLSMLAKRYHVESTYFSRLFRKETGENIMQCIARTRIERAKFYMQEVKINLTEIAFMVGYDDYTYFNKVFRKMEGISPREYRNKIEEKNGQI